MGESPRCQNTVASSLLQKEYKLEETQFLYSCETDIKKAKVFSLLHIAYTYSVYTSLHRVQKYKLRIQPPLKDQYPKGKVNKDSQAKGLNPGVKREEER